MSVRVEVLGPLQVQVDGTNTPIGGPKARAVLAALAARAGQACSVDELAEEVWGETPPSNARNSLQSHVSRLRNVLADPERIRFAEDRYTLELKVNELDAHAVEIGLEGVRGAAARSDWAEVTTNARSLLELWRGRPFDGFEDVPTARNWAARLEETRVVLAELLVEGLLAQDRLEEALIELSSLTDEHPWREGLATRQALCLYRSGRQTEALQALQDFRTNLIEATGLDPTATITDLETAILTHDPELDAKVAIELPGAPFPADLERLAAMP
ncbi:MAG: AfsR/SARP family transcriptional regulator, partial [Acidimicrobiales bacterium]|nr:AfsR/SARP family transcriptional regulator [Acidimicrobiales bacterium]